MNNIVLLSILSVGVLSGIVTFYYLVWWKRCRRFFRMRHGIRAEANIERFLNYHGYRVIGLQQSIKKKMYIDGEEYCYEVRPDAIAERNGNMFFVEAKTGHAAPNPFFSHTRRQMLEYFYGEDVEGVVLLNADTGTVQEITFSDGKNIKVVSKYSLAACFLVGLLLSALGFYVGKNL